MRGLLLRIRKKTLVPTKHALVHQTRSDWITVGVLQPQDVVRLFCHYSSNGYIKTDAQFALWIYTQWGAGIYSVLAFAKGRKGFWNFMKVECTSEGFIRLAKNQSQSEKEKLEMATEYRKLKKNFDKTEDEDERKLLKEDMSDIEEDLEMQGELVELEKPSRSGCYPYLKSIQPVYKFHNYEGHEDEIVIPENETEKQEYSLW